MLSTRMPHCTHSVILFLLSTPSSPHCLLRISRHVLQWQLPATPLAKRHRPQRSSRAQRRPNALSPGYLMVTIVRWHPMFCWFTLLAGDAKQYLVVHGAEFKEMPLAKAHDRNAYIAVSTSSALTTGVFRESATFGWSYISLIRIANARIRLVMFYIHRSIYTYE